MSATTAQTASGAAAAFSDVAIDAPEFDYAAEVQKLWDMFPQLQNNVYYVDIPSNRAVYPASRVVQHGINNWLWRSDSMQKLVKEYSEERKSSCCIPLDDGKRVILLYTADNPVATWRRFMTLQQQLTFVLDHESAHALIADANGQVDKSLGECIADAFAVIRHFQRFGADSTAVDGMVAMRAARFVFGDKDNDRGKIHFTSQVIEQVLARRHDIDWSKLNAQETMGLARRFGLMYAPHPILLERMDEKFRPCHTGPDSVPKGETAALERLADIVKTATFPVFIKYGAMALNFFAAEADAAGLKDARLAITRKAELLENSDDILAGLGDAQRQVLRKGHTKVIANQR